MFIPYTPPYALETSVSQGHVSGALSSLSFYATARSVRSASWGEVMRCENAISHFATMKDGWDGYNALAIEKATIDNAFSALKILCAFTVAPDPVPNPNGTISFFWETKKGHAHLEIGRSRFTFYIEPSVDLNPIYDQGMVGDMQPLQGLLISAYLYPESYSALTLSDFTFPITDQTQVANCAATMPETAMIGTHVRAA